jgi:hypothetical protein
MMVSEVGRMAIGFSSSEFPLRVTHATSGAKSSMWSFSACSLDSDTNLSLGWRGGYEWVSVRGFRESWG